METLHERKIMRLRAFDYSVPGLYFVTICVEGRRCLLGEIREGEMVMNKAGFIAVDEWNSLCTRFPNLDLEEHIFMPNHMHGILRLPAEEEGAINRPLRDIIRTFKARSSLRIHREVMPNFDWQRNYYDHIIRSPKAYHAITDYIRNNPKNWTKDSENTPR